MGPPLDDELLDNEYLVGETIHGDPDGGQSILNPYVATSFRWTADDQLKTIEIEELVPVRSDESDLVFSSVSTPSRTHRGGSSFTATAPSRGTTPISTPTLSTTSPAAAEATNTARSFGSTARSRPAIEHGWRVFGPPFWRIQHELLGAVPSSSVDLTWSVSFARDINIAGFARRSAGGSVGTMAIEPEQVGALTPGPRKMKASRPPSAAEPLGCRAAVDVQPSTHLRRTV